MKTVKEKEWAEHFKNAEGNVMVYLLYSEHYSLVQ